MPSTTKTTRATIEAFMSHLSARRISELPALFTTEATYWVSGNPEHVPWAASMLAHDRIPHLNAMFDSFDVFKLEQRNMVVEGQHAIVEFGVYGKLNTGLEYINDVVMSFGTDESGKIVFLKEYLDNMQSLAHLKARSQ